MLVKVFGAAVQGIDATIVTIEVNSSNSCHQHNYKFYKSQNFQVNCLQRVKIEAARIYCMKKRKQSNENIGK